MVSRHRHIFQIMHTPWSTSYFVGSQAALQGCVRAIHDLLRTLIRLKALMPEAGCRAISDVFNRRFAAKRRMTVGKTFVAELIRQHRYEIDVVRKDIKRAKPRSVPKNPRLGARSQR